jgi:hypothetical protein
MFQPLTPEEKMVNRAYFEGRLCSTHPGRLSDGKWVCSEHGSRPAGTNERGWLFNGEWVTAK